MSVLIPGDEELHYSDSSHRWVSANPDRDEAWYERVRAHVDDHRADHRADHRVPPRSDGGAARS